MKSFRWVVALAAIMLVPIAFAAMPAAAQLPDCKWSLDGEWVGQKTGNRVMIEMRRSGFFTWVSGQPKPGQSENNNMFLNTEPKVWVFTFPDGTKSVARLLGNNLLRLTNPDGWTDDFMGTPAPRCLGAAVTPPINAPAAAAPVVRRPLSSFPNPTVRAMTIPDIRALVQSEGDTVVSDNANADGPMVTAKTPDGIVYTILGMACNQGGAIGCKTLSFNVSYKISGDPAASSNQASLTHWELKVWWLAAQGGGYNLVFSHVIRLNEGSQMNALRSGLRYLLVDQAKAYNELPAGIR